MRTAQPQFNDAQQFVADLTNRRAQLTRFWHYFKRRDLDHRLVGARNALELATGELDQARGGMAVIEASSRRSFPGLSLDARRAINIAAIAYAEVLCLRLADTTLMSLAKEAVGPPRARGCLWRTAGMRGADRIDRAGARDPGEQGQRGPGREEPQRTPAASGPATVTAWIPRRHPNRSRWAKRMCWPASRSVPRRRFACPMSWARTPGTCFASCCADQRFTVCCAGGVAGRC